MFPKKTANQAAILAYMDEKHLGALPVRGVWLFPCAFRDADKQHLADQAIADSPELAAWVEEFQSSIFGG